MLVAAFQIHHGIGAAIDLADDVAELRKILAVFQHEGMRRAGIEPDVADVVDLLPLFVGKAAEETLARARRIPGIRAFGLERVADALVHCLVLQDFDRAIARLAHEHRDRHAPGALA